MFRPSCKISRWLSQSSIWVDHNFLINRRGFCASLSSSSSSSEPPFPLYTSKANESIEAKRARLLYQSRKRGMLENDLILSNFANKYLKTFNERQLAEYDYLINMPSNDWDLYYWVIGLKETPDPFKFEVMDLLKEHVKNDKKENRTRQPELSH